VNISGEILLQNALEGVFERGGIEGEEVGGARSREESARHGDQ
jgi:hypothetical protein